MKQLHGHARIGFFVLLFFVISGGVAFATPPFFGCYVLCGPCNGLSALPDGSCPNICVAYAGTSCSSPANACGVSNQGIYSCRGTCVVPNNPNNPLSPLDVFGTTPVSPPPLPPRFGESCTASNSCTPPQTNYGTVQCDGSCSASAPSSDSCNVPPGTPPGQPPGSPPSGLPPGTPPTDVSPPGQLPGNISSSLSAILNANPLSVIRGLSSRLSWSSRNATSCSGGGLGFDTRGTTAGSLTVTPLLTTFFTLSCTDRAGNQAFDSQTVIVTSPGLSITASPTLVRSGDPSTISWSVEGTVTSCTVSGPGLSSHALSGSQVETIRAESVYTITCDAGPFSPTQSVRVKVLPVFKEI